MDEKLRERIIEEVEACLDGYIYDSIHEMIADAAEEAISEYLKEQDSEGND